jgi:drug/metabolite transporter (DMT)-like permease
VLVGAALVATRSIIDQASPASLAFLRYLVGVCCLLPLVPMAHRVRFAARDLLPIALLGVAQFGVLVVLLNWSLQYIPAARAALLFASMPLLTTLLAAALRRESLTMLKMLGVLLTIAGVAAVLGEQATEFGSGARAWVGEGAALASALTGAACSLLYRPYLERYPTLPVSALAMLASVAFLAVLAARDGFFVVPPAFTTGGWLAVLFIGVSSAVGYFLWLWALKHASPTKVTIFLALAPVTASVLGALSLGEPVTPPAVLAIGLVALGLWLAHRPLRSPDDAVIPWPGAGRSP